jgi:hypothetical protein
MASVRPGIRRVSRVALAALAAASLAVAAAQAGVSGSSGPVASKSTGAVAENGRIIFRVFNGTDYDI